MIEITPQSVQLQALGLTYQFAAVAKDASGAPIPDVQFLWSSTNANVATINPGGLATATGNGTAIIIASAGSVSGDAELSVEQSASNVAITPDGATLPALGSTAQFTASARDANGYGIPDVEFEWTSEDESVVTVDASGMVTAVGTGEAAIKARLGVNDAAVPVSVVQVTASVEASRSSVTLTALAETHQLSASASDANGNVIPDAVIGWGSSDMGVVTVNQSGLVTGVGPGDALIIASNGGMSDTVTLTVSQVVATIAVDPGNAVLSGVGATVNLTATASDANGYQIGSTAFSWASSDESMATVDAAGVVTSTGPGTAQISATSDQVTASAAVTVQVEDSVIYLIADLWVVDDDPIQTSLGSFAIPTHVQELGITVYADVSLSQVTQNDESFAIGTVDAGLTKFIGDPSCPVVRDDPTLGRGWVFVGEADLSAGTLEFVARHAIAFACYAPNDGFATPNSIHFFGIKLVYWIDE